MRRWRRRWRRSLVQVLATLAALMLTHQLLLATEHPWLLPSFGGSCVILFGMPRGAMAQPRSLVVGHLLATGVGVLARLGWSALGGEPMLWAAAAVGVALALMALTRTIHSPAGANPLVVFAEQAGPGFLLVPLLPGLLALAMVAACANNLPGAWGAGGWPRPR